MPEILQVRGYTGLYMLHTTMLTDLSYICSVVCQSFSQLFANLIRTFIRAGGIEYKLVVD